VRAVERARDRWGRLGLGTMLVSVGISHFTMPKPYEEMIPGYVPGDPATVNRLAGAAEIVSGALLLNRRTREIGGWCALATIATVYVANVQAAIDGGMSHLPGFAGSKEAAYLRLPLQLPMLWLAWRQTRTVAP
jgi:uncharacterized membrane protein